MLGKTEMLDHFARSELVCSTIDEVCLINGFGETIERLRVELDVIYLRKSCW